jgi:N utilization substance protein B
MSPARKTRALGRSQARLAAVQALYQMDLAGTDLNEVIEEFKAHRLGSETEDAPSGEADVEHFAHLLSGVVRRQRDIDPLIDQQLATGWRLVRVDSIVRAILRAAALELMEFDIPARVVITEYIDVAHAFFEGDEPKLVNGVLDQLARKLKAHEFPSQP